jgi:hypothetical protein
MPPRYAYWTIIAGGLPTAFRAADREELLPTFQRIKEKHPDAEMKWFARGKLWASQEEARAADKRGGRSQPRNDRSVRDREPRTRDWRPGGEHRDPRQKFIDAKKQRNSSLRQERWQRKNAAGETPRPQGSSLAKPPTFAKPRAFGKPAAFGKPPAFGKRPPFAKRPPFGKKPPFARKPWTRAQGTEEPDQPPRPRDPNREPPPQEEPEPTPPPRPDVPVTPPPGPQERGRGARPFQRRDRFTRKPPRPPRKG